MFFEESIDCLLGSLFLVETFDCLNGVIGVFSEAAIVLWSLDCLKEEYLEIGEYWVYFIESLILEYLRVFKEKSVFIRGLFP